MMMMPPLPTGFVPFHSRAAYSDAYLRTVRWAGAVLLLCLLLAACGGGSRAVSWTGVDMLEIASQGEAVELEPVPGRFTVFDFWADWCAPCKELDRALIDLGQRYPDRLAIRKLRIIDGESPAVARYLGGAGATLPHVKVFTPSGQLALELGGKPADIAARIESVLLGTAASPAR